jgi:hypothetical protein
MGEHQKLGPNGELIHYSDLTHYEKVSTSATPQLRRRKAKMPALIECSPVA